MLANYRVVTVGFSIASDNDRLGDTLKTELASSAWTRFTAVVAFARLSGVTQVQPTIASFAESRGRVDLTVGTDLGGTSYEAVWYLHNAISSSGRILLASAEPGGTFHPKVFIFSDARHSRSTVEALSGATKALVIVGSSNLTGGGLYLNDEASAIWTPSLADGRDGRAWRTLLTELAPWLDPSGERIIGSASKASLRRLALEGILPQELSRQRGAVRGTSSRRRGRRRLPKPARLVGPQPPKLSPPPGRSTAGLDVLLARMTFGASRRWPQWELNKDVLSEFFGLSTAGDAVQRQPVSRDGKRGTSASTPLVIGTNGNRRLEFPEPDHRPDPAPRGAILVVVDRRPGPYRYAVLMPQDDGYAAIDSLISISEATGQYVDATKRVIVSFAELAAVWPGNEL